MRTRTQWLCLLFAALAAAFPAAVFDLGIDTRFHLANMECFSEQFWAGQWYPRWCFTANNGYGSPSLMLYYPLAYWISAVLMPLRDWLHLATRDIYTLNVFLASLVMAAAVRHWLKPVAGDARATFLAVLALALPYRLEVVDYRNGLGEMWCLALAPLVWHATRGVVQGSRRAWVLLVISGALVLLANVPCALGVWLVAALYVAYAARSYPMHIAAFGVAALASLSAVLPYALPAAAYADVLHHGRVSAVPTFNSYVTTITSARDMTHILYTSVGMTLGLFISAAGWAVWHRRRMGVEAVFWIAAGLLLIFLLFPISAPLWDALNALVLVGYPWRLQGALMLITLWLAATAPMPSFKRGDLAALCVFAFALLPMLFVVEYVEGQEGSIATRQALRLTADYPEYRTLWTDDAHYDVNFYARSHPAVEAVDGGCDSSVVTWQPQGVYVRVLALKPCTIRLHHVYFPTWRVLGPAGIAYGPEAHTGLMQFSVPAGRYDFALKPYSMLELMQASMRVLTARP